MLLIHYDDDDDDENDDDGCRCRNTVAVGGGRNYVSLER